MIYGGNMKEEYCIMPDNPPVWRNKRYKGLVRHEVLYGIRNRRKSIQDGLVVFLTPEMHNMSRYGVHFNKSFDKELKQIGQATWQSYYGKTEKEFIKRYGKNYL